MFDRQAKTAFVVAMVTLIVCGAGFKFAVAHYSIYLRKLPVPLRDHLISIPREKEKMDGWQAVTEDPTYDAATIESLGTDKYLTRSYVLESDLSKPRINLHIAYYTGLIDAVPHIPDRCFIAAGFEPATPAMTLDLDVDWPDAFDDEAIDVRNGEPYRVVMAEHPVYGTKDRIRLPDGDLKIRLRGYGSQKDGRFRWGGFFFIANNRVTATPAYIRTLAFKPSERYAYYCKIQIEMADRAGAETDRYVELSSEFLKTLLPHLMRCLPDWAEVQSWEDGGVTAPREET